jgi:hypothetical protein
MVNPHQKHVKCFICTKKLFNENRLEVHNEQHHPISITEGLLPDGILPPLHFAHPEQSWLDYSRCTWLAIDKLLIHDLPIASVPGVPPPEDTPNEEPIYPQQPDFTCTPDPTKTKAHGQVVGVEKSGGIGYGKATGWYNKHRKYSE